MYSDVISNANSGFETTYFSENLCVVADTNFGTDKVSSVVAKAAGVFNVDTKEVCYSQNLYEKLAPASTTKILTAYIIIRNCNLEDVVTVSDNAVALPDDASSANLKAGDMITVRDLLYGLLLPSGNDAATALAEYYSGSVEAFAKVMNQTALELGASKSHFMNPSGLHDDNHYTCVYDLYLIFNAAIEQDEFVKIIHTIKKTATYKNIQGDTVSQEYMNTNRYLLDLVDTPDNFTVIGGKTGTTEAAGKCLVLLSKNANGDRIISIVLGGDSRNNLYILMSQMLRTFGN